MLFTVSEQTIGAKIGLKTIYNDSGVESLFEKHLVLLLIMGGGLCYFNENNFCDWFLHVDETEKYKLNLTLKDKSCTIFYN